MDYFKINGKEFKNPTILFIDNINDNQDSKNCIKNNGTICPQLDESEVKKVAYTFKVPYIMDHTLKKIEKPDRQNKMKNKRQKQYFRNTRIKSRTIARTALKNLKNLKRLTFRKRKKTQKGGGQKIYFGEKNIPKAYDYISKQENINIIFATKSIIDELLHYIGEKPQNKVKPYDMFFVYKNEDYKLKGNLVEPITTTDSELEGDNDLDLILIAVGDLPYEDIYKMDTQTKFPDLSLMTCSPDVADDKDKIFSLAQLIKNIESGQGPFFKTL